MARASGTIFDIANILHPGVEFGNIRLHSDFNKSIADSDDLSWKYVGKSKIYYMESNVSQTRFLGCRTSKKKNGTLITEQNWGVEIAKWDKILVIPRYHMTGRYLCSIKPMFIYFYASWFGPNFEKNTIRPLVSEVAKIWNNYDNIGIDVTSKNKVNFSATYHQSDL